MEEYKPNANKQLAAELIKRAMERKHSNFEFIKNYNMLVAVKALKKATKSVYKAFKAEGKQQYNDYIKQMNKGFDNLQLLVNARQYFNFADFYKEEITILDNMISEFEWFSFLRPISFLELLLLNGQRKEEDLHDFSGSGFKETK